MLVRSGPERPPTLAGGFSMRRTPLIGTVLVLALSVGAGACSSDKKDDPDDIRKELSEQLQKGEDGLSKKEADCFADVLIEEVGADKLADVDFSADEPPKELQGAFAKAAVKAVSDCDIDLSGQ
jgi:hypothetical protein